MRRKICAVIAAIFLCLTLSSTTAFAATCPPHGNYQDRVTNSATWTEVHHVGTGYFVGAVEITERCTITYQQLRHTVSCGNCHLVIYSYYEPRTNHSHYKCK